MKKLFLFFALAVGLLTSASTLQAQVNMNRYITLTVTNGAAIELNFTAATDGTPIRIVSGSNTQDVTVNRIWMAYRNYTAGSTTMTVYGDITGFNCSGNGANLTAIDPLHNTQLKILYCSGNQLTSLDVSNNTQLTMLNCGNNKLSSLDVSNNTQLTMLNCYDNSLNSLDISQNTQLTELNCYNNSLNSLDISHNTQLTKLYCYDNNFTTATLDDIYCALPDRTSETNGVIQPVYNSLSSNHATVIATNKTNATAKNWKVQYYKNNTDISATTGTYVCGTPHPEPNMNSYITLTVTDGAAIYLDFKAANEGTPVRIVSGSNTQDITVGTSWKGRASYTADGTEMKVYGDITDFDCQYNEANLTALDISHNTQLTKLNCLNNSLSSLDISQNTQLTKLCCSGNKFTTATLDDIYCALPDRTSETNGVIQPVYNSSSSDTTTVLATNAANATAKNWKVQYYDDHTDIPATTGSYVCGTPHIELNMNSYITLTVKKDSAIKLDFKAAADGTPVRIVSGSNTRNITVGTGWLGEAGYTAGSTTMTVYGDLTGFDCQQNGANLTALDPSHNTQLTGLYCHGNNFSTAALDDIYCILPDRTGKESGVIQPVKNSSAPNHATVLATNKQNAIAKNWKVQYYDGDADIPTTGKHKCSATDIAEASAEPALTLYPNPVADVLYLSATARTVRIYNVYGTEVAHATDTDKVEVSHLPAGVYTVRADGSIAKMIKR